MSDPAHQLAEELRYAATVALARALFPEQRRRIEIALDLAETALGVRVDPVADLRSRVEEAGHQIFPGDRVKPAVAAWLLGVCPETTYNWRTNGRGPPLLKVGGRNFYALEDLANFTKSHRG